MPDLTPDHPAVQAADAALRAWMADLSDALPDNMMVYVLSAALPHLTADDLRDTDAAEEIRTEGWLQGWAAGRDLDGDEDATPYLRNTPAGRALMAEGRDARPPEPLPCGCENPLNAVHLLDH